MKYTLIALILGLVVLFSGGAVNAQSFNKISAKIDFDFYVANKKFEAGEYVIEKIRPQTNSDVYHLRRLDEKAQTLLILRANRVSPFLFDDGEYKLRFDRYGEDYVLSTIFNNNNTFATSFSKKKYGAQIAQNPAGSQLKQVAVNTKKIR